MHFREVAGYDLSTSSCRHPRAFFLASAAGLWLRARPWFAVMTSQDRRQDSLRWEDERHRSPGSALTEPQTTLYKPAVLFDCTNRVTSQKRSDTFIIACFMDVTGRACRQVHRGINRCICKYISGLMTNYGRKQTSRADRYRQMTAVVTRSPPLDKRRVPLKC